MLGSSRPPLVGGVAFAGHREVDAATIAQRLGEAFALVAQAFERVAGHDIDGRMAQTVAAAHAAIWPGTRPTHTLMLLTGAAPGADRAAIDVWRTGGYGEVFAVFPFIDPDAPESRAWTADPVGPDGPADPQLAVNLRTAEGRRAFDRIAVLDGASAQAETPPIHPHLRQSRWLVTWADLLVAVWDGRAADGAGGTGDAVAAALDCGLPVLWIDTTQPALRLLSSEDLWSETGPGELAAAVADPRTRDLSAPLASAERLASLLLPRFEPPCTANGAEGHEGQAADEESEMRHDYAEAILTESGDDPAGSGSGSTAERASGWSSRLVAGVWRYVERREGEPHSKNEKKEERSVGASMPFGVDSGAEIVEAAFRQADTRASVLGRLHRGVQVLLLLVAVAAVVIGTSAAVFPGIKPWVVLVEFGLGVVAWKIWKYGFIVGNHRRWGDVRRLAERLRALRATRPVGFDVVVSRRAAPDTWTEWQANAVRRRAGPPIGVFTAALVRDTCERARLDPDGIVVGQARYHDCNAERLLRTHHRLEKVEAAAALLLFAVLGLFLIWDAGLWVLSHWFGEASMSTEHGDEGIHHLFASIVLWVSAVVPTIAAACLAAEAKLGFEENGQRSRFFAEEFSSLDREFVATTSTAEAGEVLRRAATILVSDIDWWREGAVRRRISTF